MKKVRLVLTTIMIVATVSGALAFKAHKLGSTIYCSTVASTGNACLQISNSTFTENTDTGAQFCTSSPNNRNCSIQSDISVLN